MPAAIASVIAEKAEWAREHRSAARLQQMMRDLGCVIYGAGGFGRETAERLVAHGYSVKGFIDARGEPGLMLDGHPVLSRAMIGAEDAAGTVLVMAINNFKTPVDEVIGWARAVGFAEIVPVPELTDVIAPGAGIYWQSHRGLMSDHAAELAELESLLADETSRRILRQLVAYRISGDPADHPVVDRDRQYFPEDLPLPQPAIAVIDCGAFPGDLLETADKAQVRLDQWFAFEPDPKNFRYLADFVEQRRDDLGSAVLVPCGVGGESGVVGFAAGNADASRAVDLAAAPGALDVVSIVRLEDVLKLDRLDMVKLDLEGFEAAALDGRSGLLNRHHPRLAVAIYHKPADLWELPLKINAMLPGGRFHLRQHGYNGYDTVLYVDWA